MGETNKQRIDITYICILYNKVIYTYTQIYAAQIGYMKKKTRRNNILKLLLLSRVMLYMVRGDVLIQLNATR